MEKSPTTSSGPSGASFGRQPGGCFAPLYYVALLTAGLIVFCAFFFRPLCDSVAALLWVETPCKIFISEVQPVRSGVKAQPRKPPDEQPIVGYRPHIRYSYRVGGKPFQSSRIGLLPESADTLSDANATATRYPTGLETRCYVNPKDPDFAVLERGFTPALLIGVVPLALMVMGAAGLIGRLAEWRRIRPVDELDPWRDLPPPPAPSSEPITFKGHAHGRLFTRILAMAAAYNVLVWFIVREVIDNWREGVPGCYGWLLTLFAVPFTAMGLLLAGASIYFFLRLFNPRPVVQLSSGMVLVGQSVGVSWHFAGAVSRMSRLRIFGEGREEVALMHHGRIRTQVETFMTVPIVDAANLSEMRSGEAQLTIPADARPSTRTQQMRIVWVLRVCGDVRRWPNVDEQFEFVVGSASGGA